LINIGLFNHTFLHSPSLIAKKIIYTRSKQLQIVFEGFIRDEFRINKRKILEIAFFHHI